MRVRRCGLVVAAWVAACAMGFGTARVAAADPRPRLVNPPRALGQLIPEDAVALFYFRSADEAEACLNELQHSSGGDDQPRVNLLDRAVNGTEVRLARVHRRRPLAVALSLGGLGQPVQTTVILPLADRKGFELDRPGIPASKTVVVKGSYAGISPLPGYAASRATPAFASKLLDSPIAVRLRPYRVAPILRIVTEAMSGQTMAEKCLPASGAAPADSVAALCEWLVAMQAVTRGLCDGMDALQAVDVGLGAEHGMATMKYVLTPVAGHRGLLPTGVQARAATDLARCLPHDYPTVAIWALDFAHLAEFYAPLATALQRAPGWRMPLAWQDLSVAVQNAGLELLRANRGGILSAAGPGPRGIEWVGIHLVGDAERIAGRHRDELLRSFTDRPGFHLTSDPMASQGGAAAYTYRLRLDLAALRAAGGPDSADTMLLQEVMGRLMGSEEIVGRVAGVHDKLFLALQPDPAFLGELLARAQRTETASPAWLQPVLASPPDTLCWYARTDLQAMLAPLADLENLDALDAGLARALRALRQAAPAPVVLRGTVSRGVYRGELRADVAHLHDLFAALAEAAAAQAHAPEDGAPKPVEP